MGRHRGQNSRSSVGSTVVEWYTSAYCVRHIGNVVRGGKLGTACSGRKVNLVLLPLELSSGGGKCCPHCLLPHVSSNWVP
jgi:hypothetical protein